MSWTLLIYSLNGITYFLALRYNSDYSSIFIHVNSFFPNGKYLIKKWALDYVSKWNYNDKKVEKDKVEMLFSQENRYDVARVHY